MMTIQEKIDLLPFDARQEIYDFIDFIIEKNNKDEKRYWKELNQKSVDKIWNNTEDDIYNELL